MQEGAEIIRLVHEAKPTRSELSQLTTHSSLFTTAVFNMSQKLFHATLIAFTPYGASSGRFNEGDYACRAPISCVVDIDLSTDEYPMPVRFQVVGLKVTYEDSDFCNVVTDLFDLTCTQFAIEDPHFPDVVRPLNNNVLDLFSKSQFLYHMLKFTNTYTFCKRVKKYIDRGYMFIGINLRDHHTLEFECASLRNNESGEYHDGELGFVSSTFNNLRNSMKVIPASCIEDSNPETLSSYINKYTSMRVSPRLIVTETNDVYSGEISSRKRTRTQKKI